MFLFLAYGMLSCRWRNRKKCFLRRLTVCVCLLARKLLFIHVKMADVACPLLYLSLLKVVGKEYPGLNLSNGVISLCGIHTASRLVRELSVRELVLGIAISELILVNVAAPPIRSVLQSGYFSGFRTWGVNQSLRVSYVLFPSLSFSSLAMLSPLPVPIPQPQSRIKH